MQRRMICLAVLFLAVWVSSAGALVAIPDSGSKVLIPVNDPQEMRFTDLDPLIEYTKAQLEKNGTLSDQDVVNFYDVLRGHGAPNANPGGATAKVALIVSPEQPANEAILVVKGSFDRAKVLEIISRRYEEHINDHLSDQQQKDQRIGAVVKPVLGFKTYRFIMPVRARELHIVDIGDCTVFGSHKQGSMGLVEKTVQVLAGKLPLRAESAQAPVVMYAIEPSEGEKSQILNQIDESFSKYTSGALNYKRGVARFTETIKNIVAKSKVSRVKDAVNNMTSSVFRVNRVAGNPSAKNVALAMEFQDEATAQQVKAASVKHLVAEMKKPVNQSMVLALQNPKITAQGNTVNLQIPLPTEADQMQAFAVCSTYVARQILGTRQPPLVRRLKSIADQQAWLGREVEQKLAGELARTSFFSFQKYSLMYSKMRVKSGIRQCEDLYVEMTNDPKVLARSVEKLADVASRDLQTLDNLIASRAKAYQRPALVSPQIAREFSVLGAIRRAAANNAQNLIMTARSPGMANLLGKDAVKKLAALAKTAGGLLPMPRGVTQPMNEPVAGVQAVAGTSQTPKITQVVIPAGMTLEQAQKEYQAALKEYTDIIAKNDEAKAREANDRYVAKYAVYQALLEKLEQEREEAAKTQSNLK